MSEDNQLAVYEEAAIRHNAAYAAFRSIYEAKTPPPVRPEDERDHVSLIIILALVVVTVASVIVSATRTVAEFGQNGLVAFVMVEGGMLAYSFFRARRGGGSERLENSRRLALAGLVLAFITAIFANIDAVLTADGILLPEAVNTAIALLVALSAPVMTFISSDVLALELMAGNHKRQRVITIYNEQMKEWTDGLNRSWSAQQGRWGVRIEVEQPKALPVESGGNLRKFTEIDRPSPKLSLALEWMRSHPEHMETESRQLGEMIGVSHATANKARRIVKQEQSDEN